MEKETLTWKKEPHQFEMEFPEGEWTNEPDKVQFYDQETGYTCLIVRNHFGVLCGYVGVPSTHHYYRKPYMGLDLEVHGGLTFSDFCADSEDPFDICHIPYPGEEDAVWWLGFDCAHSSDTVPSMMLRIYDRGDTYKNLEYVKKECRELARQLKQCQ